MPDELIYLVRDRQGRLFGPANAQMLRDWVSQGRIVAAMSIGRRDTQEWIEASRHPAVADLLQAASAAPLSATPEIIDSPEVTVDYHTPEDTADAPARARAGNPLATLAFLLAAATSCGTCASCLPWISGLAVPVTGLMALFAIVLGALALWQMNAYPYHYRGRALAILGVILGIMALFAQFAIVIARTLWAWHF